MPKPRNTSPHSDAHRRERPQSPRGASGDGGMLGAAMPRAAQRESQRHGRYHREHGLEQQQPLELPVAAHRGAEQQGQKYPHEASRRAHRDTRSALIHRQVLAGKLAHSAEDDRLGHRDRYLPRHRPGERVATQPNHPAQRDERAAAPQHGAKPSIQQHAGRNRERRRTAAGRSRPASQRRRPTPRSGVPSRW